MANNQRAWGVPYSTRDYHDNYAKMMAPKPISLANKPAPAHSPVMRTDRWSSRSIGSSFRSPS